VTYGFYRTDNQINNCRNQEKIHLYPSGVLVSRQPRLLARLGIVSRGLISVNLPSYCMAKPSPQHAGHPVLVALGDAIKRTRLQQGVSQEGLALSAGLDRSYVGGIERGEHNLTVINLVKLADALGLTASELLKRGRQ